MNNYFKFKGLKIKGLLGIKDKVSNHFVLSLSIYGDGSKTCFKGIMGL